MASEIQLLAPAGATLYFFILNSAGQVWNTDTEDFETISEANRALYAIPASASNITTLYLGSAPSSLPAGVYGIQPWRQLGGSPASSDPFRPNGILEWGGDSETVLSPLTDANIADIAAAVGAAIGTGAAPAGKCRVFAYEFDGLEIPIDGRAVTAEIVNPPQTTAAGILETTRKITSSNAAGYWFFDLVIGKQYRIVISQAGVRHTFTVPDLSTYDFRAYLASL